MFNFEPPTCIRLAQKPRVVTWSFLTLSRRDCTKITSQKKATYLGYILSATTNLPEMSCVVFLNHVTNPLESGIVRSQPRHCYALGHSSCFTRSWQVKPFDDHMLQWSPCIWKVPEITTHKFEKMINHMLMGLRSEMGADAEGLSKLLT